MVHRCRCDQHSRALGRFHPGAGSQALHPGAATLGPGVPDFGGSPRPAAGHHLFLSGTPRGSGLRSQLYHQRRRQPHGEPRDRRNQRAGRRPSDPALHLQPQRRHQLRSDGELHRRRHRLPQNRLHRHRRHTSDQDAHVCGQFCHHHGHGRSNS